MSNRRFYEREPKVKQAVDTLFLFPLDIQKIIAKGFSMVAERDCQANEILNEFKSLGTEKVLALYSAKMRRRKYDQNPTVHQAMLYLMIMSEESQFFLATKIIDLIGFMQDYFRLCKEYSIAPGTETAEAITDTYVKRGPAETRAFIAKLDQEFKMRLLGQPDTPKPEQPPAPAKPKALAEGIASENTGMRIRGDVI